MLHLRPKSSAGAPLSLKLEIEVKKVLNMDVFIHKCITSHQKAFQYGCPLLRVCLHSVCVCVCVCVCGHVYVVYEDTNLYNNMGMT